MNDYCISYVSCCWALVDLRHSKRHVIWYDICEDCWDWQWPTWWCGRWTCDTWGWYCHTATGTHVPYGITQCYLPPGRGDIPAFTPAKAGTRFSDPGGMQGWVDLQWWRQKELDAGIGRVDMVVQCWVFASKNLFLPDIRIKQPKQV